MQQPVPGKQGKGLKYALIGCGCLVLLAIAVVVILGITGHELLGSGGGHGSCAKAAACCKAIIAKSGGNPAPCDNLTRSDMPNIACHEAYVTYRKSARALGVSCK
jgi:hypothetical protein